MIRLLTGFAGATIEAWQELRIHRTRVLLSLIGVAVAVCSLSSVVALGGILQQANIEMSERSSGRPAALAVNVSSLSGGDVDPQLLQQTWNDTVARYGIHYASRNLSGSTEDVQFPDGVSTVAVTAVDQPYGVMHRVTLSHGDWFAPEDAQRLAPALVVNSVFWQRLGSPDLSTHPTVSLGDEPGTTAVIRAVYPAPPFETQPSMYLLIDSFLALPPPLEQPDDPGVPQGFRPTPQLQYELWVPPANSTALMAAVKRDFRAALGEGVQVQVNRNDYAQRGDDPFLSFKLVIGGIALLVLLLGALGLLNIALVTVRQRIREIGIRRSFGATAGRIFFSVMMESVVATVAAGCVGVMASVLLIKNPIVENLVSQGTVTDFPPFPVDAAVLGLVAATVVGALAGLLPALVAVRVKVIDAIRY